MDSTWLVLAVGVVCAAAAAFGLLRARRQRNESQILKMEIRKWEDEGGNVPQVPTVNPAGTPDRSVPTRL